MKIKILTFNWHEPYLCLLSKMDHQFLVVEPEIAPEKLRKWNLGMRPIPNNFELISMAQAHERLEEGEVDHIFVPKMMYMHDVYGGRWSARCGAHSPLAVMWRTVER